MHREAAALIALGWRCLYAEITHARVDNVQIDLKRALKRTIAMSIARIKAYGERWHRWYRRICHTPKCKLVQTKHTKQYTRYTQDDPGNTNRPEYTIVQAGAFGRAQRNIKTRPQPLLPCPPNPIGAPPSSLIVDGGLSHIYCEP